MPDGQRAVSASGDKTLKVWDFGERRSSSRTLIGHTRLGHCGGGDAGRAARGLGVCRQHAEGVGTLASGQELRTLSGHSQLMSGRWR